VAVTVDDHIVYNTVDNRSGASARQFNGEPVKICIAGEGAIAQKHLDGLARVDGVDVVSIAGGNAADTEAVATKRGIPFWSLDLNEAMNQPGVEAVILTTPTQLHASQAIAVMEAGKHVLIEIPMADSLADAEAVVAAQERTGVTAMVCHTRRFNPSHQFVHNRVVGGELVLQHFVVETFFFRRENKNALGKPRSWTDHLLWHHSCHTVDLFRYQTGEEPDIMWAQQGPMHPQLGIAMDMTIGLRAPKSGALCTLALSFNNNGPLGTFFRYICDNGTYIARYDDLVDGYDQAVDLSGVAVSTDGIELQDREFISAILEGREPNSSVAQCLPTMQVVDRLAQSLAEK
jgi:2-hydroxy-4-carboxymuconate semialdehyde hemiacetal dehydrogenase